MEKHKSVPVTAAARVAADYDKQVVVIYSEDTTHNRIQVTSYGELPEHKIRAAALADQLHAKMKKSGNVVTDSDFRAHQEAALNKWKLDQLLSFVDELASRTHTGDAGVDAVSTEAMELLAVIRKGPQSS